MILNPPGKPSICPSEPSHDLLKAQGNQNEPSRALLKALGIQNGSNVVIDSSSSRSSILSIWMFNPHHMRRNPVFFSVDNEHYEEEYLLFRYSIGIAKEGSNYDKLYVHYDIQDESDMYLLQSQIRVPRRMSLFWFIKT